MEYHTNTNQRLNEPTQVGTFSKKWLGLLQGTENNARTCEYGGGTCQTAHDFDRRDAVL